MVKLFSPDTRYRTWRRLWAALARQEHRLGLPVTEEQVRELEAHTDDIDYDFVRAKEKETRHDVMAHILAYGAAAPGAAGVIHLGATSCYVTDNADLILFRDALAHIRGEVLDLLGNLARFAEKYKNVPALGYTHYQPAQPVTVGRRAALWMQDLESDLDEIGFVLSGMRFLGCRGATGTEAGFVTLFGGDTAKIDEMNRALAAAFGFDGCFALSGQTYPRKLDWRILSALSSVAQSCCRMATDIRLLQHDRELEEPFGDGQVGSSAMPYKRNPVRCERICSLSRYLICDAMNAAMTAYSQWLERTLDDSADRRISMPEGFLCADAVLRLSQSVTASLRVNEKRAEANLRKYLPFIATEDVMMQAVRRGASRQEAHSIIRACSMEAVRRMDGGEDCGLAELLASQPGLRLGDGELRALLDPCRYAGRSAEQTERYLEKLRPLLAHAGADPQIDV